MNRAAVELSVGIFVLAAAALLMWGTVQVGSLPGLSSPEGREMVARFADVSGLEEETAVLIAGVRVGRVDDIRLDGQHARVTLRIEDPEVRLPVDSEVGIRGRGLLGERVVEIRPGDSDQLLPDGAVFTRTHEAPNLDVLLTQATAIATDVKQVSTSLRNVLGGAAGEESLRETLANVRAATGDLKKVIETNAAGIESVVRNLDTFSGDLAGLSQSKRQQVAELLDNLHGSSQKLNVSLARLGKVAASVEKGEGSLGRLLTDDELYEEIDGAISDVRVTLREVRRAAEEAQEQIPVSVLTSVFGSLF